MINNESLMLYMGFEEVGLQISQILTIWIFEDIMDGCC